MTFSASGSSFVAGGLHVPDDDDDDDDDDEDDVDDDVTDAPILPVIG